MKKFLLLIIIFSTNHYSQQLIEPEWRNYTNSEKTNSIVEEGDYIWLGTYGGLVKFNKSTQQKLFFNKGNSILPSNHITSIVVDSTGYKWVCTNNGLVKFKDEDWTVYKKDNSGLPENQLLCIAIDYAGNKWIGTLDSGLVMYDGENWIIYNQQNSSLNSNQIRTLKADNDILWIGTYDGLYKRENNDFTYINVVGNRHISCIEKDVHGDTWIGSSTGLFKLTSIDSITTFSTDIITSLGIDNHNIKWFGTGVYYSYNAGMRNIDSADIQVTISYLVNSATDYPWFFSIFLEPSDVKWFGSGNGLVKADVNAEFINVSNSALGRIYVTKLFIDSNDRKWFYAWGSIPLSEPVLPPGYLASYSDTNWTAYNLINSPVDIGGVAAVSDFYGTDMFVAIYSIGGNTELYHYSSGTWALVTVPQTQYNLILYMWFDNATGKLWVDFEGANGDNNLFTYDGYVWMSVPDYPVYDINKMKRLNDLLWIASPQGLIKYDGTSFSLYNTSNSGLPDNFVSSVDFDSAGNLWAGTRRGIVKFDGTNWIVYDRYNSPLSCDDISGLAIDLSGDIFLGTNSIGYPPSYIPSLGLVKFDGTNWTFFNSDNSGKPDVSYGWEDISDLSIDETGKVWIATLGGVGVYDEDGIPVPVELLSFNSFVVNNNDITLNWSTASETNNQGFEIQRSLTPTSRNESGTGFSQKEGVFEIIAFIPGFGTTTEPKSYSFIDEGLSAGIYQYRLKQIDFDGSYEYSNIVEVEITFPTKFSLEQNYPNPFNPSTNIQYAISSRQFVSLKIFNSLGEEIETLVNELQEAGVHYKLYPSGINSTLSSGVYYYQLKAGSFVQTKKMILLR